MRPRAMIMAMLLTLGCASAPEEDQEAVPAAPSATELEDARSAIDRAIGEAPASTLSQCALAAIGERPCGGPRTYLAYSIVATDSADLAALVAVYDRLDRQRNAEQGLISTCELMAPPELALVNGRCVTAPMAGGAVPIR